ncbi:hypothetical protein PG985_011416 [Apiospora marii]|uniref:ATPase AAA-type core domain-containing protein n=1 Tax=Apiospora marii TaxID=335849 RepID=A0ABR1STN3_9PEZI
MSQCESTSNEPAVEDNAKSPHNSLETASVRAEPEGSVTATIQSSCGVDDVGKTEVESVPQIDPNSKLKYTASLWCPVSQRLHSNLMDFNLSSCPTCGQHFHHRELERTGSSSPSLSESGSESDEDSNKDEQDTELVTTKALVINKVDFRDTEDLCVEFVSWPVTFELEEERKNLVLDDNLAFEVVTILNTSMQPTVAGYPRNPIMDMPSPPPTPMPMGSHPRGPPNAARSQTRRSRMDIMRSRILNDPKLDVSVRRTDIIIHSKALIEMIKSVVFYYPGVNLDGKTVQLSEPFALIAHYYPQLESLLVETEGLINQQLESLLRFVKQPKYISPIEEEISRNARGYCTFRMLWYLLRPGSTVYLSRDGNLSAQVIAKVDVDEKILRPEAKSVEPYEISMWYLDFDGRHVGRCEESASIPAFEGERTIASLRVFPVQYRDDADGGRTKTELEELGKRWFGYLMGTQAHYKGEFMGPLGRQFDGRVFIDNAAYIQEASGRLPPQPPPSRPPPMRPGPGRPPGRRGSPPGPPPPPKPYVVRKSYSDLPTVGDMDDMGEGGSICSCDDCRGKRVHPPPGFQWVAYDLIDPKTTRTLDLAGSPHGRDHRYLLCSHRVFGFVFKSRRWEILDVKFCSPARVQPKAINSLVMPEDRKIMIQALVEQYNTANTQGGDVKRKQWGADFIESKGEGQIFLLHGGPGVGKSLPLLSLNVGDIGTFEEKVEQRLSYWFNLAEKWGAVMLIDEADVYLERRSVSDLRRNGIVSVFLRCMEYYRGILFLTTNRVGQFDDAFVSRIHLVIHYEPLGDRERRKIWTQFFEKLEAERKDISITSRARNYVFGDPEINDVEWNGREIRNAFPTAVALADYQFSAKENKSEYETAELDQKHFQQICGMALQFKGYLTNLHGMDEHERAFVAKARDDGT